MAVHRSDWEQSYFSRMTGRIAVWQKLAAVARTMMAEQGGKPPNRQLGGKPPTPAILRKLNNPKERAAEWGTSTANSQAKSI